jgi:hypothetical protein
VIALTETWLNEDVLNAEIQIPGYDIFRQDRKGKRGGGVLIYLEKSIPAIQFYPNTEIETKTEILYVTLRLKKPLNIGLVYRPPNQDMDTDDLLLREIKEFCRKNELLLLGDFNAADIDWNLMSVDSSENTFASKFLKLTLDEFLVQHVNNNTRFRLGQRDSCLDLVISKDEDDVQNLKMMPPLGLSDHNVITWEFLHLQEARTPSPARRNVWKADLQSMRTHLQRFDLLSLLDDNIEQSWNNFKNLLSTLIELYCPLLPARSSTKPKWMNRHIRTKLNQKARAWRLARTTLLDCHQLRYRALRNECKSLIRTARTTYDSTILEIAVTEPKKFYAHINSKLKCKDRIPCIQISPAQEATTDHMKANALSNFFQSVFVKEDEIFASEHTPYTDMRLETINILEDDVNKVLRLLKPAKAAGPDSIPSRLLKELADEFAPVLTRIFRQSLDCGLLPSDWKLAHISPIYKGGSKHAPNSYRPISLTCICCKLLERLIKKAMTDFLEGNQLLNDAQHGFREKRSCLTNLLYSFERWTKYMDEHTPVDVIYIDFKKAFDSVPHKRLMKKLSLHGIDGKLLQWIEGFVTGRSQCVQVNGIPSDWVAVESGVPQGSVLGPLLFIVYVNDIPELLDCDILMFADDIKIWKQIKTPSDCFNLQKDLDILEQWSHTWLLSFNNAKCSTLRISSNHEQETQTYYLNNTALPVAEKEKDLGVIVHKSLKPSIQCAKAAAKATSVMRRIKRAFPVISIEMFGKIYGSFVRSHLEYAVQAWMPWLKKDKILLENVQRRSTKLVTGLFNVNHQEREQILGLFPLSYRQLRGDLILTYKLVRTPDFPLRMEDFFSLSRSVQLRGHPWKLTKERSNLLTRQSSFSQRVINKWNSLPSSVVAAPTLEIFKFSLDNFLANTDTQIFFSSG